MNRRTYIYIGAGILVTALLLFSLWSFFASPNNSSENGAGTGTGGQTNNVPQYTLSPQVEEYIKLYTKNIAEDFQTYSYLDYRTLFNVQGNSTPNFALDVQKMIDKVSALSGDKSYSILTTAEPNSFSYQYPSAQKLTVSISGKTTEKLNGKSQERAVAFEIELIQSNDLWLVDEITIQKK